MESRLENVRWLGLFVSLSLLGCGDDKSDGESKNQAGNGGEGAVSSTGGKSSGSAGKSSSGGEASSGNGSGGTEGPTTVKGRETDDDCRVTPKEGQPPSDLKVGVWKNISPADFSDTFGANSIDIDPTQPLTLYASLDEQGVWKTTDGGTTWKKLGDLDSPLRIAVDPCDARHLYATEGVRGDKMGFWVSKDGGASWARPAGFEKILPTATEDITTLAVDPENFSHILLGSHSPWPDQDGAGVLESIDFGETWTKHGPAGGFQAGSIGIGFGSNSQTWIVNGDESGTWRTTDGGATWKQVSELSGTHGGSELYRDNSGALFLGGFGSPYKSTDDGATWASVGEGLPFSYYLSVGGDGKNLYTGPSFPAADSMNDQAIFTSAEGDGTTWKEAGSQRFDNGPYRTRFDKVHGILYTANWQAGVWALKVAP